MECIQAAIIFSKSLSTHDVSLISVKDPRLDSGLLTFGKAKYVDVAPDLMNISSCKEEIEYVKNEFYCIGTEILKKWRGDVLGPGRLFCLSSIC